MSTILMNFPDFSVDPLFSVVVGATAGHRAGVPSIGRDFTVGGDRYLDPLGTTIGESSSFRIRQRVIINSAPANGIIEFGGRLGMSTAAPDSFSVRLNISTTVNVVNAILFFAGSFSQTAFITNLDVSVENDLLLDISYSSQTKFISVIIRRFSDNVILRTITSAAANSTPDWAIDNWGLPPQLGSTSTADVDIMSIVLTEGPFTNPEILQSSGLNLNSSIILEIS